MKSFFGKKSPSVQQQPVVITAENVMQYWEDLRLKDSSALHPLRGLKDLNTATILAQEDDKYLEQIRRRICSYFEEFADDESTYRSQLESFLSNRLPEIESRIIALSPPDSHEEIRGRFRRDEDMVAAARTRPSH